MPFLLYNFGIYKKGELWCQILCVHSAVKKVHTHTTIWSARCAAQWPGSRTVMHCADRSAHHDIQLAWSFGMDLKAVTAAKEVRNKRAKWLSRVTCERDSIDTMKPNCVFVCFWYFLLLALCVAFWKRAASFPWALSTLHMLLVRCGRRVLLMFVNRPRRYARHSGACSHTGQVY